MKTSAPDSAPRLTCRLARSWISIVGDAATAGENGHVAHCADCQAFFSAGDELELALRRDAAPHRDFVPAGLEQNILQAIQRSARPRRRGLGLPLLSLAGFAAAAAAVALVLRQPPESTSTETIVVDAGDVTAAQAFVGEIPANLFATLRPEAEAILRQDPLQGEIDAVASNARTAFRFLAANFLPSNAQPLPQPRSG